MADRNIDITVRIRNETSEFHRQQRIQFQQTTQAATKAARQQAADAVRAAKESERAWAKAEADRLREFRKIQAERIRDQKRAEAEEKRSASESVRAWTRAANDQIREFRRVQAEQAKASRQAEREAKRSAAEQARAYKKAQDAIGGSNSLVSSLKSLAAGYIGVSVAARGLEFLNTSWESYNQSIKTGIADLREYRDAVKELANLKDRLGNTTTETKAQLLFRSGTLQNRSDAIAYQEGFLNTAQAAVASKAITKAESDALMRMGGSYQAAAGGSADTQGNFLGGLPAIMASQGKGAVTANQAFNKFGQVRKILAEGGSGENAGFAQLLTNSAYTSTGLYRDIAQQAALQSMFSTSSPNSAGTLVDQFTRATVGGLGKMRGQGVEGGEKLNGYLKGIGATEAMDPIQIGRLISRDLVKQRADATAKGQTFSDYGYLSRHGYTDQETRDAILQFSAKEQSGSLDAFLGMANAPADATEINQRIKEFRADPAGQARAVELSGEMANASISAGPQEFYNRMKELAFNQLKAENPKYYSGTFEEWDKNGTWNAPFKKDVLNRASQIMIGEANRVGAYIPQGREFSNGGLAAPTFEAANPLDYSFTQSSTSRGDQEQQYYKYYQAIGQKGGDPISAALNRIAVAAEKQLTKTEGVEKAVKDAMKPKGPQPKAAAGNVGRVAP